MDDNITLLTPSLSFNQSDRDAIYAQGGEDSREELSALMDAMNAIARPKILYGVFPVGERDESGVTINGVRIKSALMRENFERVGRVFPYIVTCGKELADYAATLDDPLSQYWADEIMKRWLFKAFSSMNEHIRERFDISGRMARMNPGSIKEWPLTGQSQLFAVLGGTEAVEREIGVRLTRSMLMLPSKSVSGISFATESGYENCSRCPIITCPGRRVQYNPKLIKEENT